MVKLHFSRNLRLLKPDHFAFVFQKPKLVRIQQMVILGRINTLVYPRVGMIIAKKYIKLAHERNHIKRLIRESFRLNQHKLCIMDFIIIAKSGLTKMNNFDIIKALEKLWHRYYRL
ncbi:ribonuclease P protein component [Candidatus Palibaumannia cicadellinicola]|uniref:Ribonuclease P protein component n=1 Tax=Baumannia cicadellinicola subsp. Homalodisca coagulata TaxID=374463 RepID=RNPA_BAUCH|nr:ribonuclease P protein component [Candidatus Baumannia cicadellinicola]Q1LTW1.1 RecName: Full=Ribonuclease P protein component; Short=RNase P protein; Short=RNaseP protein; AltName: Full=Protein C5 [Baumannia cicadellinicola str. Hc (Homalodisca coagulata)]ABF13929.1 ribonuclease P protein component [Baumannia cicadellinicola str. Hc (Homalodisca coagulata)]MBS0032658.1 ribonuclease P protein component [Candidatus Baumannia cicadellinicola]MCJ7462416.1 ribonuclease P protein component [Candi